ncbi:MAG TPA: tRNA (adenosine(37)-N6)-dimethylallyltransferase MiaA [Actinomycetota bacterium]|nr:tRNA (adenosine(37)-N6)-dimethylallyltransferase MiaA [Actinomycetota bacterium]
MRTQTTRGRAAAPGAPGLMPQPPGSTGLPRTNAPLALVGPTASGKTEASIELARRLGAEILVVDSMTVYRGMDVGTAKPTPQHRAAVPHHLLDVADPSEPFSVARFQALARHALGRVTARGRTALLVGGSGLYFRAAVDDLAFPGTDPAVRRRLEAEAAALGAEPLHARLSAVDPEAAARIGPPNVRRTVRALEVIGLTGRPFSSFASRWERFDPGAVRAAGVRVEPSALARRIEERVRRMWADGLLEEVRALLDRGLGGFLTASKAIGYLEAGEHLAGHLTRREAEEATVRRTRALARRQVAWFRRDPRIRWFDADERGGAALVDRVEEHLRG